MNRLAEAIEYHEEAEGSSFLPKDTSHISYGNQTTYGIPEGPDVLSQPQLRRNEHQDHTVLKDFQFSYEDFSMCLDSLSNSAAPGPDEIPAVMPSFSVTSLEAPTEVAISQLSSSWPM